MRTTPTETSKSIRQRAEEKAYLDGVTDSKPLSLVEAQKLIHELQVSQIELELQNEELRLKQDRLDAAHIQVALASVVENSDNFIVCKDMDLRVVAANLAFAQACGHASVAELIGKTDAEIFNASPDSEPVRTYMEAERRVQQLPRGEYILYEEPVNLPIGKAMYMLIKKFPVYTEEGCLIGTGTISTDITVRKFAELQLQEANLFSEQVIHCAQEGIIVYDMDLRYRAWNPFMENLTGLTAGEVLGKHPLELFPFLQDTGVFESLNLALAGETPGPTDFQYSGSKTGVSGWISDLSAPLRNVQGEIVGVIATVRDISYRKQLEGELLHNNMNLKELIAERTYQLTEAQRIAHIGSWERNFQTKKSIWSDEVYRIFGLEVQQAPATFELLMDCIHPEDHSLLNVSYERSVKENIPFDIVPRIIKKTSFETRHIHLQCIHLRSPDGRVVKSIGTFHDITELVVKENALKEYTCHVVEMIENERTRIARELHDDLGQKLTVLSFALRQLRHDHPELLKDSPHLPDMRQTVDGIMESIRRICTTLRPPLLDELGLLAALELLCKDLLRRTGILYSIDCNGRKSGCCNNKSMDCSMAIFRIVQESLNNIIKHATASKVSIALFKNDNTLTLEIIDDGCGFNTKKVTGGKSFGIIGIRERANSLGATFDIISKRGEGTTVRLVIPCHCQENMNESSCR